MEHCPIERKHAEVHAVTPPEWLRVHAEHEPEPRESPPPSRQRDNPKDHAAPVGPLLHSVR